MDVSYGVISSVIYIVIILLILGIDSMLYNIIIGYISNEYNVIYYVVVFIVQFRLCYCKAV